MNLSPREVTFSESPVFAFFYPEMDNAGSESSEPDSGGTAQQAEAAPVAAGPSPAEIEAMRQQARAQASEETERNLRQEFDEKLAREASRIGAAIESFAHERQAYFSRVEAEVVRLALAIAARVLHREAQVDPMLLAALVRIAVDKMHEGTSVTVRVGSGLAAQWRHYLGGTINGSTITVVEDPQAGAEDCTLETEMGTADFAIATQLKEVEQGFFDLLAHRPTIE